jgi:hypothetical protein
VRATSGVCQVVEGAGGVGGSWTANCAAAPSSDGSLFFCTDSKCSVNCQRQNFEASKCVAITNSLAPSAAKSFNAFCLQPTPAPSAKPSTSPAASLATPAPVQTGGAGAALAGPLAVAAALLGVVVAAAI